MRRFLILVVLAVVVSVGLYAWRFFSIFDDTRAPHANSEPKQSAKGEPRKTVQETHESPPQENSDPVHIEPIAKDVSVKELISSLVSFAKEADLPNCRKLLAELRKHPDAATAARQRFVDETSVAGEPRGRLYVLSFLGVLLAEADFELLFKPLRENWTKTVLSPNREGAWEKVAIHPLELPASRALTDDGDKLLVNVAAFVIREHALDRKSDVLKKLLAQSTQSYVGIEAEPVALPEIPDPWLSALIEGIVPQLVARKVEDSILQILKSYCAELYSTRVYSVRLRHQARCMFLEPAKDEMSFLTNLSRSESKQEAARVIGLYLDHLGHAQIDWVLLWALISHKFGRSDASFVIIDALHKTNLLRDFEKGRQFADSFIDQVSAVALGDSETYLLNQTMRGLVVVVGSAWIVKKGTRAYPPVFGGRSAQALKLCKMLVSRHNVLKATIGENGSSVYAANLAMNILDCGEHFSDVVRALKDLLETRESWHASLIAPVIEGLHERFSLEIIEQNAAATEFFTFVLEQCTALTRGGATKQGDLRYKSLLLVHMSASLRLLQGPVLSEKARAGLAAVANSLKELISAGADKELAAAVRALKDAGYLPE